jgi:3-oxoacyl-[acyl-carrier protein] reductase
MEWEVPRTVLITGGSKGIGLGAARAFAEAGDRVAVTYRRGEPPPGLFSTRCDVTDTDAVKAAFEAVRAEYGPVEVLIANAGINREALLLTMSEQNFHDVIDTNLTGAFRCAKQAVEDMVRARWGRLIFVSSSVGFSGSPAQANYAASKAALLGLARSLAWELGGRKVTANVICPGYIDTDMTATITDKRRESLLTQIPLRRTGTVEEVAGMARFLASDAASYITGALIPVTGGLGMGH